jgi:hypothetical protein
LFIRPLTFGNRFNDDEKLQISSHFTIVISTRKLIKSPMILHMHVSTMPTSARRNFGRPDYGAIIISISSVVVSSHREDMKISLAPMSGSGKPIKIVTVNTFQPKLVV